MKSKAKILLISFLCFLAVLAYYEVLTQKSYSDILPNSFNEKLHLNSLGLVREFCSESKFSCIPYSLIVWILLFVVSSLLFFKTENNLIFCLLLVTAFVFTLTATLSLHDSRERGKAWVEPIISREEYFALDWIRNNTVEKTVFASDIFGGELIMGNTLRLTLEGGDWAITPNVIQRMSDANILFTTNDSKVAWDLAIKCNCSYIWLPNRQIFMGYGWKEPEVTTFEDERYFTLVFQNKTRIFKVNKNP